MSAVFEVVTGSVRDAQQMLPQGMTAEKRELVVALTAAIRASHYDAAVAMVKTVHSIRELHGIIEDTEVFENYCQRAFNFSRATVYRYLKAGRSVQHHFVDEHGSVSPLVRHVNLDVLQLLGADTDPRVIDNIKLLAAEKGQVTKADAQVFIDQATAEYKRQLEEQGDAVIDLKATLANTEAQLIESRREHRDESARADRNELQLRNRERAYAKLEGELDAHRQDIDKAEATIKELQSKPVEVQFEEKIVEKLPAEYATVEEAVAAIQTRRADLEAQTEQLAGAVEAKRSELSSIEASLVAAQTAVATLEKLKGDIDHIVRQVPQAISEAVASSPNARLQIDQFAGKLRALADVLSPQGEGHA